MDKQVCKKGFHVTESHTQLSTEDTGHTWDLGSTVGWVTRGSLDFHRPGVVHTASACPSPLPRVVPHLCCYVTQGKRDH